MDPTQKPQPTIPALWSECWDHLVSLPHHGMFALGAFQTVLVMLWWLVDLGGRYAGWYTPVSWTIPAPWAHLYLMIFSIFPPFMFGFLMTTYPRWMASAPVSARHYLPSSALLACGVLLGYAGLVTSKPLLLVALATYLAGWAIGLFALLRVYSDAERPNTSHAIVTSAVLIIGWCLLLTYTIGIGLDNPTLVGIARAGGIWWFLFPVFFAVSHRMIPFFTGAVIPNYTVVRPDWALWTLTIGGMAHGGLEMAGLTQWTWIVDLPIAAIALWLSYQWSLRKTLKVYILAMLHIAFAWVGIALLLFGIQSLTQLMNAGLLLGRGPLHALAIGYFASMLVAMSTRVTLGHSGQPLIADQRAWTIFVTIQATALIRALAEFPYIQAYAPYIYLFSGALWLAAFSGWLFKFTPTFLTKP